MRLFGREAELKILTELIDGAGDHSGVLIRGEAGIGKSTLVAEAVAAARAAGLRVLTTTGVPAEHDLDYAGLHQLLHPVRAGVDALPAPQRAALRSALGLAEATDPSLYLVAMAALTLLAEVAADRPLLVVAEDVHWLDRASVDVLAFVARRIESEPVVLVATLREGERSPMLDAGLFPMAVQRLSDEAAAELLDTAAPGLPAPTRTALLVAALNQSDSAAETLAATRLILRSAAEPGAVGPGAHALDALALDVLAPAVDARLIELGLGAVTFRHPLMRSAIPAAATLAERRRVRARAPHHRGPPPGGGASRAGGGAVRLARRAAVRRDGHHGLEINGVLREALDHHLRWRDPAGYERMHRRIRRYVMGELLRDAREPHASAAVMRTIGHLRRRGGVAHRYVSRAARRTYARPGLPRPTTTSSSPWRTRPTASSPPRPSGSGWTAARRRSTCSDAGRATGCAPT
ncbi:ATP-binding protein [Nonomuraea zeae]|uniref:ATP-binding protein n=1 Tax=Nonomuraea zeae TaxID=1642303 RepID=A0A5S4H0A1_9ACTN|nr:ATP-binding protein [Nonomuraea zeae]TMR38597.1 ATP-binding protein [Nonomuraea zeae]